MIELIYKYHASHSRIAQHGDYLANGIFMAFGGIARVRVLSVWGVQTNTGKSSQVYSNININCSPLNLRYNIKDKVLKLQLPLQTNV